MARFVMLDEVWDMLDTCLPGYERRASKEYWTVKSHVYAGEKQPSADERSRLHHVAHEQCFVANSVKTEIIVR